MVWSYLKEMGSSQSNKEFTQPVGELNPSVAAPETTAPPTVQDETVNWKTYRNEKYGFEFKYPTNLTLTSVSYEGIELAENTRHDYENEKYFIDVIEGTDHGFALRGNASTISYDPNRKAWVITSHTGITHRLDSSYWYFPSSTDSGLSVYWVQASHPGGWPIYVVPLSTSSLLELFPGGDYWSDDIQKVLLSIGTI